MGLFDLDAGERKPRNSFLWVLDLDFLNGLIRLLGFGDDFFFYEFVYRFGCGVRYRCILGDFVGLGCWSSVFLGSNS